jgi:diguanylate cyclase (GGDEF)-like protein
MRTMKWGLFHLLALWFGVAVLLAVPSPGVAQTTASQSFAPGSICRAGAKWGEEYARIAVVAARWDCSENNRSISGPRIFLRFDLRGKGAAPTEFSTRLGRFAGMRLTAIAADGRTSSRVVTLADMVPTSTNWGMHTALPRIAGPLSAVVAEMDEPRNAAVLVEARLVSGVQQPASFVRELLIAMLCGALLVPLVFNVAFYRILRERFLLWHALATAFMVMQTMVTSGLVNRFFVFSVDTLTIVSAVTLCGGLIAASLFSADLIEPGKLDPLHRALLRWVGLWVPFWTAFYLFADGPLRPFAAPLYLMSFLPLIGLFGWTMAAAKRRGSRAVNFQIAAWLPLMITAAVRIASALGATEKPLDLLLVQHLALGLEVIITSLGAMDRMMAIRQQRDVALAEARLMVARAERDHLTGLLNRRALERRFPEMRTGGFHAMAVLDLDKFKGINDTYGHVKGDAVLRAVALALAPDKDTLAARMGGEEFLILLRGEDVAGRAERRRQAITTRVAADVPGLDRLVTASMGMVEMPADGSLQNELDPLYARCDLLLYEAKAAGRNRTMREKIQSFAARPPVARVA